MPATASRLSAETRRALLLTMLESRHGDMREESLNRQGKGHFHVSGQGHEGMAAIGRLMEPGDYACPYYRDRGFVLGRGVTTRQLALDYMAKRDSSSRGRQMPSHYSYPEFHIWSVPTPTASQLLPACGMAWGMKLDASKSLTVATVGDAATRQGDFFEAVSFARERGLPLLLVVEDNGYGISSPTRRSNPLALGVIDEALWVRVDGWDVERVHAAAEEAMARIRSGAGPAFIWMKLERLTSHTSSDDHKIYRSSEELSSLSERDPCRILRDQMVSEGALTPGEFEAIEAEVREKVRADYAAAEGAENPRAAELEANVVHAMPNLDEEIFKPGRYRIGDLINLTIRAGLDADPHRVVFGEDVEDPKGGVFRLTRGLSTDFKEQVFNSPLAESTILGVACGLASYGWRPVFELQFIDFIYPGWNQLVTNLATLRWRTFGRWTCPAVIYAPYGAYLPGGSLWHSQANEAAIAHFPGLNVVIPSTPEDAVGLLWTAMHGDDPTLFLIPKHMLWAEREVTEPISAVPIGQARCMREGSDVTVVAWGNTVEVSLEAMAMLGDAVSVELIDLRSIVPWDREAVEESVRKTGRLVVVQEDTENCSVGQMIISHLAGRPDVWSRMASPPQLVSKGNVMIGYSPVYENAALPDASRVAEAVRRSVSATQPRASRAAEAAHRHEAGRPDQGPGPSVAVVTMPVMGEGIRAARIVTLSKKPGEAVARDEAICEVETEKAVYPVQSSVSGVLKEWRCAVDESVGVGREIAFISVDAGQAPAAPAPRPGPDAAAARHPPPRGTVVPPVLPAPITRRVAAVVPANMQLDARWEAIRAAREEAKRSKRGYSPSLMLGWCITRAMDRHAAFRRLVLKDGSIVELAEFDLGVAVALEGDRLATAALHGANRLDWAGFAAAYTKAVADTRAGAVEDVQAPLNITSLGSFGIEQAVPIVVPPSMGTLFIGRAHERMINDKGSIYPAEVATLSLTFDHKVVNGAGAAAFLHDVVAEIEAFRLPAKA